MNFVNHFKEEIHDFPPNSAENYYFLSNYDKIFLKIALKSTVWWIEMVVNEVSLPVGTTRIRKMESSCKGWGRFGRVCWPMRGRKERSTQIPRKRKKGDRLEKQGISRIIVTTGLKGYGGWSKVDHDDSNAWWVTMMIQMPDGSWWWFRCRIVHGNDPFGAATSWNSGTLAHAFQCGTIGT